MTETIEKEAFIATQRAWLLDYKQTTGLSWPQIGKRLGVSDSTLSLFGGGKYAGRNDELAEKVQEYRALQDQQAELDGLVAEVPGYFETPTSKTFIAQLQWAHRGKMIAIAGVPGCGKTQAIFYYRDLHPSSVIYIKVRPSDAGLANMLLAVLRALGKRDEVGSPQRLSNLVMDLIADRNMLLIFDEAHELSDKAFEEIRGWHDLISIGVAFVGEPRLVQKIRATGRAAKPALSRRTTIFETAKVKPTDVEALCQAWGTGDLEEIRLMKQVARLDGALGECTQVMELASLIAGGRGEMRRLEHIIAACQQRGLDFRSIRGGE